MKWSRFNVYFKSGDGNYLLYNSGTNTFALLYGEANEIIEEIIKNPDMDCSGFPDFYLRLRFGGFLVENDGDDKLVRIIKMKRLASNYRGDKLMLTIAPNTDCNFSCEYCYGQSRKPSYMTNETCEKLIDFILCNKKLSELDITWYGGEPLLTYETIVRMSKKIKAIDKGFQAQLITNGYLLNKEFADALDEMNITKVQITLDGQENVHNKRRPLKTGRGTFDRIIENIDGLMISGWRGILHIRTNVDGRNYKDYAGLHDFIKTRYPEDFGRRIKLYPGFVDSHGGGASGFMFNEDDKSGFLIGLSKKHGIKPLPIFPRPVFDGCTLTKQNAYVIGPRGELYKCWRDLGKSEEEVGNIDGMGSLDMLKISEGMVGSSYLHDTSCENCTFFPICDGGCHKIRVCNIRDKGNRNTCAYFKYRTKELLELHYQGQLLN